MSEEHDIIMGNIKVNKQCMLNIKPGEVLPVEGAYHLIVPDGSAHQLYAIVCTDIIELEDGTEHKNIMPVIIWSGKHHGVEELDPDVHNVEYLN